MRRHLIVNADDFGMTDGINEGVVEAHERGIVTSASLMVRRPAAESGAAYAARRPELSLGLHVDLGEWVYRGGEWLPRYEVVDIGDREEVSAEVERQVTTFHELVGTAPTHLDSHQHVHRHGPAATVLRDVGRRLHAPVRHQLGDVAYRGDFYGQDGRGERYPEALTVEALLGVFGSLRVGWSELGCHPGRAYDVDDRYGAEREVELAVLCNERVQDGLQAHGVSLRSFADLTEVAYE